MKSSCARFALARLDGKLGERPRFQSGPVWSPRLLGILERCKFFAVSWQWNSCRSTIASMPSKHSSHDALSVPDSFHHHSSLRYSSIFPALLTFEKILLDLIDYCCLHGFFRRQDSEWQRGNSKSQVWPQWHFGSHRTINCSMQASKKHSVQPRKSCWTSVRTWQMLHRSQRRAPMTKAACDKPCKHTVHRPCNRTIEYGSLFWCLWGQVRRNLSALQHNWPCLCLMKIADVPSRKDLFHTINRYCYFQPQVASQLLYFTSWSVV